MKIILEQEVKYTVVLDDELKAQESKSDLEMVYQSDTNSMISNITSSKMEVKDN